MEEHFRTVADASGLPVVLYDIPGRTGTRIESDTMIRLAEHPRIVAVKDCSYDFLAAQKVLSRTEGGVGRSSFFGSLCRKAVHVHGA